MKFAFSTLGLPGLPLAEVARLAARHGYSGVELRVHPEEPVHLGASGAARAEAAAMLRRAGVEIIGIAGYTQVAAPGDDHAVLAEIDALVRLAGDLGAGHVRVFPGGQEAPSPEEADDTAVRRLADAARLVGDARVRVLLETHDSHRRGTDVARVLDRVADGRIGALWDVMHTWLGGECPGQSLTALTPHLGYVQVKDAASTEDTTPLPLGEGALPLAECVTALSDQGFDGWLCWEYEKRWYKNAAPLPQLLADGRAYLDQLLGERADVRGGPGEN
ncbi:xylose isomerase [Streptomyces maremycinicus]|nr:xylose isomerase [Streptomyces sp. B9173]